MGNNLNLAFFFLLGCGNEEGDVGDYCTEKFGNPGCLEIDVRPYRQNGKGERDGETQLICWRTPPRSPLLHSVVGSGHPGSSGTVCSPISQWDLGNNWKLQVPRIWALLLPVHVKIVVLFSQLQAHCGPSKPTHPSAAWPDGTLSVQLACFVQLFCVYSNCWGTVSFKTLIVWQDWKVASFFCFNL